MGAVQTYPYPQLIGLRIQHEGPIEDLYLELPEGLHVLYGRNGAGKTRILRGVRDAVLGGATNGSQTLVYHWPVPNVGDDQWFRSDERHSVERAHWENLPGNPWPSVGRQQEVHGWFDEDFRELAEGVSIDDALRRLEDSIPKDRNHFIQKAIKNLTDANLTYANLTGATLAGATLTGANLYGVDGWDTVKGKNTIVGLDTASNVPG